MIFAISDAVWTALIGAFLAGYMEWSRRRTISKVDAVKDEIKEDVKFVKTEVANVVTEVANAVTVAEKAVKKVEAVEVVTNKVLQLANGNMGEQLRIGMTSAKTLVLSSQQAGHPDLEKHVALEKAATDKYEAHQASEKASMPSPLSVEKVS